MPPPWPIMRPQAASPYWQQTPLPGQGYLSGLRRQVVQMDVVNGFDQTLGKTMTITRTGKAAAFTKNLGNLSTRQRLGRMSGQLNNSPYARLMDVYA